MPKLIDLDSSSRFKDCKRTEILESDTNGKLQHHCDAIVLTEASDDFIIVAAIPCVERLGHTYFVHRVGFPNPVAIHQLIEGNHIRVQDKDFGHIYQARYQ